MRRYLPVILGTLASACILGVGLMLFRAGQGADAPFQLFSLSVLLAAVIGGLVFYLVRLPIQLQAKVDQTIAERVQSDDRLKDFADAASDWFWEMGPDFCFTYISGRFTEVTGYKPEDRIGIRRTDLVCPDELTKYPEKWEKHFKDMEARRPFKNFEYSYFAADGSVRFTSLSGVPIYGPDGEYLGYRGTSSDITKARAITESLQEKTALIEFLHKTAVDANNATSVEAAARQCLKDICEFINWPLGHAFFWKTAKSEHSLSNMIWHMDNHNLSAFTAFQDRTQRHAYQPEGALVGQAIKLKSPVWIEDVASEPDFKRREEAKNCNLHSAIALPILIGSEVVGTLELFSTEIHPKDDQLLEDLGQIGTQLGRVLERHESDAQLKTHMNELASEVLVRKRVEEKIKHLANHDTLTGLPSLRLGRDRLSSALASAKRSKSLAALMFVDLDGFKAVNDTLGHEAGDQVLVEIAKRLTDCIRETDTVARIGGDEFLVILTDVHTHEDAGGVAKKMVELVSAPFILGSNEAEIGASIGIALFPEHGDSADQLIKRADIAMYNVKRQGKNNFAFVSSGED